MLRLFGESYGALPDAVPVLGFFHDAGEDKGTSIFWR